MTPTSFPVGRTECTLINDGQVRFTEAAARRKLFAGAPAEALSRELAAYLDEHGSLPTGTVCMLLHGGGTVALVDAGSVSELATHWDLPTGQLLSGLAELGVQPEDVEHVLVTHAHLDHVGGLVAHQPVELHERVLQRCRSQEQLLSRRQRGPDCRRNLGSGLVNVAKPVSLVENGQISAHARKVVGPTSREVI